MSLNWNAKDAPHWEELEPETATKLIFATMAVDMGEITEKNHEEFFKRYAMFCSAVGEKLDVTLEDVRKGIGLHTNVFTTTAAAYKKRLYGILERHAADALFYQRQKLQEETA